MAAGQAFVRSKPFTQFEKDELQRCMLNYAAIVENKKSDATTLKKKQEAWISLWKEYNSSGQVTERTVQQLKRAWESMKALTRKSTAAVLRHRGMGTGEGPSIPDPPPNPLMEQLVPHLVHFVDQKQDSDVSGFFPIGNDGAGCSATTTVLDFVFADDEESQVDVTVPAVVQNLKPLAGNRVPVETPGATNSDSATKDSGKSSTRFSLISEEHRERMEQLTMDASRKASLHELHILEAEAALRAADFKANREQLLYEGELEEQAFQKERRRLVLDQMREKHDLECKRLGK